LLTRIFVHATDPGTIKAETVAAGYELVESHDFLRLAELPRVPPVNEPVCLTGLRNMARAAEPRAAGSRKRSSGSRSR
jgi:hypothetical protein